MIIKGVSDIRRIRGTNTRPGPLSESNTLLVLYQLATEKEHLMKKLQWIQLQNNQAEKRLSEIARMVRTVETRRILRQSTPHTDFHSRFIEY